MKNLNFAQTSFYFFNFTFDKGKAIYHVQNFKTF